MLTHLSYIHTYIHVTLLLLDPHDIHHEGKYFFKIFINTLNKILAEYHGDDVV